MAGNDWNLWLSEKWRRLGKLVEACVCKISVMRQCHSAFDVIHGQRLGVCQCGFPGGGVADMTDSKVPFNCFNSVS